MLFINPIAVKGVAGAVELARRLPAIPFVFVESWHPAADDLELPSNVTLLQTAVTVHATPPPPDLPTLDGDALAALPTSAITRIGELHASGRWPDLDVDIDILARLAQVAEDRAEGTDLEPFGLCHSEFHPTSIHLTDAGWHLLDWARAFIGPGLLDLASWQNTTESPDLAGLDKLVNAYVAAGGAASARADRGGLTPAQWAFGWHRLWVIDWFLAQATTWIADPTSDELYQHVIRRHLSEAVACLRPN